MSRATHCFILVVYSCICRGVLSEERLRELLLGQARTRILNWYPDSSLTEAPKHKDGVSISMLRKDMMCGGDIVPVTFAEFDVVGVRPVDIFNTMLDTPRQKDWNPQCKSVTPVGDWRDRGVRAWAVVFEIPMLSNREFTQWQAADADFEKQEFWLVFSTHQNEELLKLNPLGSGAVDSQNCLGAYHITKTAAGSHVIITQNVNPHPFFQFPLHMILDLFTVAWTGTIDFITQMSDRAKHLGSNVSNTNTTTDAPAYMLSHAWESMRPVDAPSMPTQAAVTQPSTPSQAAVIAPSTPNQGAATEPSIHNQPAVTFACFVFQGVVQWLGSWDIRTHQTIAQAKECKRRHEGHQTLAIVQVYHYSDGDIAKWFYVWLPRFDSQAKALKEKVENKFPMILGSMAEATAKADIDLPWPAGRPATRLNKVGRQASDSDAWLSSEAPVVQPESKIPLFQLGGFALLGASVVVCIGFLARNVLAGTAGRPRTRHLLAAAAAHDEDTSDVENSQE